MQVPEKQVQALDSRPYYNLGRVIFKVLLKESGEQEKSKAKWL